MISVHSNALLDKKLYCSRSKDPVKISKEIRGGRHACLESIVGSIGPGDGGAWRVSTQDPG